MIYGSLHEVRQTCWTSLAKIKNVRRGASVKFYQMSGEEVKMFGEAQTFVYTDQRDKSITKGPV